LLNFLTIFLAAWLQGKNRAKLLYPWLKLILKDIQTVFFLKELNFLHYFSIFNPTTALVALMGQDSFWLSELTSQVLVQLRAVSLYCKLHKFKHVVYSYYKL